MPKVEKLCTYILPVTLYPHTFDLSQNRIMYNNALTGQINSFLDSSDFCNLLITFANSLDPDHDRHSVDPDLDPNCLTL